ncbi:thioredoxin-like [Ischnura elegans]|uniref:thioredoxin-like n=1 Tax=Ischnura elegans TaxID=197161 RepID=UPI001ED8A4CC|nr:thioredoxin-like [Ischnura elegans]XP_046400382.1 thioredoxin-like [Ischnura elegans]
MAIHIQSKDDLDARLKEAGDSLVVIDFSAVWCGPCKMIGPVFKSLATENPTVVFLEVDVDECDDIASEYSVTAMPTFIFLKGGQKITSFSGANAEKLKELVAANK